MNRHHNAPPLAERLGIDHEGLATAVADAVAPPALPPIFGDNDLPAYTERAKYLKDMAAMVEKARKREKDQILKDGRTIDDFFKGMAAPVLKAIEEFVDAINAHQRKMLAEKRAAEEAARKAAEAEATPFDDPVNVIPIKPAEATRVVSSTGRVSATAQTVWSHELVDLAAVPREYLTLNDARVKAAIAAGVREIPGLRIVENLRTSIR